MSHMSGVPLLVPGLILLLAGSHWFSGAATVGLILTILGAIPVLFVVGALAGAAAIALLKR